MNNSPTKTEAIKAFLLGMTRPDLAALYSADMEVQVNVAQENGIRIKTGEFKGREWNAFTDNNITWKPFRIPLKAKSEPEYTDHPIQFPLGQYAEGVGMTGWDWKNKCSRWVAFDFDAIAGHSEKHNKKLDERQLSEVRDRLTAVPFVTLRHSTSGKGLHLYIFLEPVTTANHNEHAALARAILSMLSGLTAFDFASKVDVCGGNMWVWHRKMYTNWDMRMMGHGLELIKAGEKLTQIPANWRDHIKVVTRNSPKSLPSFVYDLPVNDPDRLFGELTGQRAKVTLDCEHLALINYLTDNNACWWWDQDSWMLVAHTADLKEAHGPLKMRGQFETVATGSLRGHDHNCFGGDTEVLTPEGGVKIRELARRGKAKLYVQTSMGMAWIECEVKSFGVQPTHLMAFGDSNHCRTTFNHNWLQANKPDRLQTWELKPGKTQLPLAPITPVEPDMEGYAHGFVFGDGWVEGNYCDVALFKNDNDLLRMLLQFGIQGSQKYKNHGYVNMVRQLPNHWKTLPINPTPAYALGFILGLMSADGFVGNHIQIFQSEWSVLEEVRHLAMLAGLRVGQVRKYGTGGFENAQQGYAISINTYNIKPEWIIRQDQRALFVRRSKATTTTVSYIDWSHPVVEEVYCAIVPLYANFTLGNGVITSNCFMFPLRNGAWAVRRYSPGTQEASTWEQDGHGWTRCFLNKEYDLHTLARLHEGVAHEKGGYHFRHASSIANVLTALGINITIPPWLSSRKGMVRYSAKDSQIIVHITSEASDDGSQMKDWIQEKGLWKKVFRTTLVTSEPEGRENYDDFLRHITSGGQDAGWVLKRDTTWSEEPLVHVRAALGSMGHDGKDAAQIIGSSVIKAWDLVNMPFQPEYPGGRQWNRNAAQLAVVPSLDLENLKYPSWQKILDHCGEGLNEAVSTNAWCQQVGISTGAEYLMLWISSLFKRPTMPMTYLAFYGPQDSGKSIFHEMISEILITSGWVRADNALQSDQNFNGEFANCILAVIEETDLSKHRSAYNKIKDLTTSPQLAIRPLYTQQYMVPNTLHFVQTMNDQDHCPIPDGDTRITLIYVNSIPPAEMIPKFELMARLRKEAPDFLAAVLAMELPPSNSRLIVPTINTTAKARAAEKNMTLLEEFLATECYEIPGALISAEQFHNEMNLWLEDANDKKHWTKNRIGRELPEKFPRGRTGSADDQGRYYGNLTTKKDTPPSDPYVLIGAYLKKAVKPKPEQPSA